MHRFRVTDRDADGQWIALSDSAGRHHIARATSDVPPVGVTLAGSKPGLGFRVLACTQTDRPFRVIFEQIDVDRSVINERASG